jgi:hypothetical protein
MDDPLVGTEWRGRMVQFRARETHTLIFPCPDDRMLVLFMGPAEEITEFRRDPEKWDRMLAANPRLAERTRGATNATKLRSTGDTTAFFRASAGPGWALVGDAGHFKDPVIAQGIRDALRFGRLLGEAAAPALDDPRALDRALYAAERRRDRECQPSYHWGNRESRAQACSPLVVEVLRTFAGATPDLMDTFNRVRRPEDVIGPAHQVRGLVNALRRPGADRAAVLREAREEVLMDVDVRLERLFGGFRSRRPSRTERTDYDWPGPVPIGRPAGQPPAGREAQAVAP